MGRRLFAALHRRPWLGTLLLVSLPGLWLGLVYLGSLSTLLVQSVFHLDGYTGQVVRQPSLATWRDLRAKLSGPATSSASTSGS